MKRSIPSLVFAVVFLVITIIQWKSSTMLDHVFYLSAVTGFILIWVFSNVRKKDK